MVERGQVSICLILLSAQAIDLLCQANNYTPKTPLSTMLITLKLASLIFLAIPTVLSKSAGEIYQNETCTEEWPPDGPNNQNCLTACGFFSGRVVADYFTFASNSCHVAIVQAANGGYPGQVVSDACGSLAARCPRKNATSEFMSTGDKGTPKGLKGTVRITNGDQWLPSYQRAGLSLLTASEGEYTLNREDCSQALQNGAATIGSPQPSSGWTYHSGGCNATVSVMDPSKPVFGGHVSLVGQDVLNVPENCNAAGFCRTFINSTIADPDKVTWRTFVVFRAQQGG